MNWKRIAGTVGALGIIVLLVLVGLRLKEYTSLPAYSSIDTTEDVTKITVTHGYINGQHTYAGTIPAPTPCHDVVHNVSVMESFPEQIKIDFETRPGADLCAQVVSKIPFNVAVEASEQATLTATLNGYRVLTYITDTVTASSSDAGAERDEDTASTRNASSTEEDGEAESPKENTNNIE